MRKALIGAGAALAAALTACGDAGTGTTNVEMAGPEETQNRLETMPEATRNAVFIRAIRDAGQECQHVESSERAGEHQGFPVWNANCQGGGTWTIVVMNDGTAAVLNAAEARLVDGEAPAPANAQEP